MIDSKPGLEDSVSWTFLTHSKCRLNQLLLGRLTWPESPGLIHPAELELAAVESLAELHGCGFRSAKVEMAALTGSLR